MKFVKMLVALSTAAVMAFSAAVSASALGSQKGGGTEYVYRINPDGNAVFEYVNTDESTFTIPETVEQDGKDVPVVGVDNFTFALCENLEVINVPDTLTLEQTGPVAFITASCVEDFLDMELGDTATIDDAIKYIAKKAEYKGGNYTDKDLGELTVKLENKIKDIDLSGSDTIIGKIMTIISNIENLELSTKNRSNYRAWLNTITYDGLTLAGSQEAPMKTYAAGKEILGMKYQSFVLGDANGDGKFTVRDAAWVARTLASGVKIEITANPAADYNQDGQVSIRDAAAMARKLAGNE